MNVTQRLLVNSVQYLYDDVVNIQVIPQVVDDTGAILGSSGFQPLSCRQPDLVALGVTHGRTDGEWGDAEVTARVLAETVPDQPAIPEVPAVYNDDGRAAVAEVRAEDGTVTTPAEAAVPPTVKTPAVPAIAATVKPRFGDVTTVVFSERRPV